jgi:hypothetical protein
MANEFGWRFFHEYIKFFMLKFETADGIEWSFGVEL